MLRDVAACLLPDWGNQPMEHREEGAWCFQGREVLENLQNSWPSCHPFSYRHQTGAPEGRAWPGNVKALHSPPPPALAFHTGHLPPLSSQPPVCKPTLPHLQNLQSRVRQSGRCERPHGSSGPIWLNYNENQQVGEARLRKAATKSGLLQV